MSVRVILVTQDDPIYIPYFLKTFFKNISSAIEIIKVEILDPNNESSLKFVKKLLNFYGILNFSKLGSMYLYKKLKRSIGLSTYSVQSICKKQGIEYDHLSDVNNKRFINQIKQNNIDVILSVSSPQIFKKPLLDAPNSGCINVHTAKLPKYRGLLPTFWALYHGDEEIGVSVHTMEEKVDQGKILLQKTFPVKEEYSLDDVIKKGKVFGGRLAAEALRQIENGTAELKEMEGESSYFSFPKKKHRKEFQERGGELL